MKKPAVRRQREVPLPGISAVARVDRRTKNLTKRLRPGEIAVIDHIDLDRVSAETLVARRPVAVVNAAPSVSGRYQNLGPEIVVAAGIPLVDGVGTDGQGHGDDLRPVEVATGQAHRLVGVGHEGGRGIGVRVDRDAAKTHGPRRAEDAARDLAPVGDQHAGEWAAHRRKTP